MLGFQIARSYSSIILGHPILSLVHVPLLIRDRVQTVIDIVARAGQVLAELGRATEWTGLLQHVRGLSNLAVASFVKYLAVIRNELCNKLKESVRNQINSANPR